MLGVNERYEVYNKRYYTKKYRELTILRVYRYTISKYLDGYRGLTKSTEGTSQSPLVARGHGWYADKVSNGIGAVRLILRGKNALQPIQILFYRKLTLKKIRTKSWLRICCGNGNLCIAGARATWSWNPLSLKFSTTFSPPSSWHASEIEREQIDQEKKKKFIVKLVKEQKKTARTTILSEWMHTIISYPNIFFFFHVHIHTAKEMRQKMFRFLLRCI